MRTNFIERIFVHGNELEELREKKDEVARHFEDLYAVKMTYSLKELNCSFNRLKEQSM